MCPRLFPLRPHSALPGRYRQAGLCVGAGAYFDVTAPAGQSGVDRLARSSSLWNGALVVLVEKEFYNEGTKFSIKLANSVVVVRNLRGFEASW